MSATMADGAKVDNASSKGASLSTEDRLQLFDPRIPEILKPDDIFSIQVGDSLFRFSGASLSSDAPNYFTDFFLPFRDEPEEVRPVLYIDRSADVFQLIAKHLRGYQVIPEDEKMFIYLFADVAYFRLQKLQEALKSSAVLIRVGSTLFRFTKELFESPGNSPNYITLGFVANFGTQHVPVLHKQLIRPVPLMPSDIPDRSPTLFRLLIDVLEGVKRPNDFDTGLRKALIKECRFYRFRGLEQQLIRHSIRQHVGFNGEYEEITLALEDIRLKGSYLSIQCFSDSLGDFSQQVFYKRPFVDTKDRLLVMQLENDCAMLQCISGNWKPTIAGSSSEIMVALMIKIHQDLNISTPPPTKETLEHIALVLKAPDVTVDGQPFEVAHHLDVEELTSKKRKRATSTTSEEPLQEIVLSKSQWRLVIDAADGTISLELLKAVGYSTWSNSSRMLL